MSSKPRKAFDGVGRPQGFIDDAAKAALKAVKGAASRYSVMRGPLRRNVKDSIKGAAKKDNVVLNMYSNQYKKPPKPKELPSIKGKSPRPMPSKPNPRAQTTAQADMTQRKAERDWAKNKRKNYRG